MVLINEREPAISRFVQQVKNALCLIFTAAIVAASCKEAPAKPAEESYAPKENLETVLIPATPVLPVTESLATIIQDTVIDPDNKTRPDFLEGSIYLPDTHNHAKREYHAGSGGKDEAFPSIPYGTYVITGRRNSDLIGKLSGDKVVFEIENMFDAKVNRERTAMLLHKATVPDKPVSYGCIVVMPAEYNLFKAHLTEALKEHGKLVVSVSPLSGKANVAFAVKKAEDVLQNNYVSVPVAPFRPG
jgi:hypothetical protein